MSHTDPVVQRRRLLAYNQKTMVRVHPGSFKPRSDAIDVCGTSEQIPKVLAEQSGMLATLSRWRRGFKSHRGRLTTHVYWIEGREQAEHACPALLLQRLDQVVQLVDTRRSERRAPRGLGSSNLPLVTAGRAGARRAFIRLATRIVTGVCNCWVSLFVSHVEASRRMSVNCHLKHADQPRRTDFWFRVSMSYAPEREENRTLARTG